MKKIYLLLFLSASLGFAQIPANYYSTATGTGYALKTQLKTIITNGHNDQGYNALWTLYTNTALRDNYYENDGSLLDLYSEKPTGTDSYNYTSTSQQCGNIAVEGTCYNREHLIAQSYFDDTAVNPMKNDAHHVLPSDGKVNGWRGNYAFGIVDVSAGSNPCNSGASNIPCYSTNGSLKGNNKNSGYSAGYSSIVFEPINEFKGDVARAFFYFATRYETQMASFYSNPLNNSEVKAMFDGTNNKVFSNTFLEIMKQWHILDPVSPYEIAKNNQIYYNFQGNRNPFIDNQSYVTAIWGLPLSTASFELIADINIYPNPSNNQRVNIETENELDDIQLININGQIMQEIKKPSAQNHTYTLENLPKGFYFLKLSADSRSITKKIIIN
ncbi:ribonuclease [Flavobacterium psychrophilum]|uniref:endonuclease n=1 Tax=Flavobacterium psychrophilum TaxID=96345 RepID=UPI0009045C0B|nr:endonuclease [Flavobacterium psychrophilum]ELI6455978.1 endonuclease [Flavobacterium psychrophilum]ELY2008993.1 endonuclease [Flavobacterium psychrophilum]OJH13420.1 ribonuclease [Flavobacterium psychrophilum]